MYSDVNSGAGKGLKDLMYQNTNTNIIHQENVLELNIQNVIPNPTQPRKYFNEDSISELADSINEYGVIQPIICKKEGDMYIIVAGERRYRASKKLGLPSIPAIIRNYNQSTLQEVALLENLQRDNLTPVEEAIAYQHLIDEFDLTHEELAKRVSKSRSYITNLLGLLRLPKQVQESITSGAISMSHARVLSKLENTKDVTDLANNIIKNNLSVRQVEDISKSLKGQSNVKQTINSEYKELEDLLKKSYNLTSKVTSKKITININDISDIITLKKRLKDEI